ncbi:hypothetical protein CEXT_782981 [Caerostris extrusa]|uniref:Uncharacterized protein n=1 Tax=Caerostris extrusa TaxID=172846 RepID=A0AAV4R5X6_CAEEX|nr:hypothetical protein CEXT_782981 [Caerostris extrusa]
MVKENEEIRGRKKKRKENLRSLSELAPLSLSPTRRRVRSFFPDASIPQSGPIGRTERMQCIPYCHTPLPWRRPTRCTPLGDSVRM